MPIRKSSIVGSSIPSGETTDRPASPAIGDQFYNGTIGVLEIYTASGWLPATGANDFNVAVNGLVTSATFTKEYFSGAYTITSSLSDTSFDIYLYNASNQLAGYTNSPSINASINFNKIVVFGGTAGDLLSFTYKTTFTATTTTSETIAPAFISSTTPTALNSVDDTTTITGGNFDTDVEVYFIGSDNTERAAKNIVRTSSSQLIVTRPDTFPTNLGTYKLKVVNPGTTLPTSTNLHILNNAVTAGTTPNWTTGTTLPEVGINIPYTTTLVATDTEGTDIDYSVVSGALPSGLQLDSETGVIAGTVTSGFSTTTFTIRAVDTGGNTVDRTFSMFADTPVWVTSESLNIVATTTSISSQLSATDLGTVTYSVQSGNLPAGYSLNSSTGVISGTFSGAVSSTATLRATDAAGNFADRTFNISIGGNGSTGALAASSAQALTNAGITTNGLYWINLGNSQGAQQVYCLLNPAIDGGGWMVIYGTPSGATTQEVRFSAERQAESTVPITGNYSLNYARRSGVNAIASQNQSLVYKNPTEWMRLTGKIWDSSSHNSGQYRFEFNTTILTSNGTTDSTAEVGLTNYSVDTGGDFGIANNSNGLDHHNTSSYYNLNGGCENHYIYQYGAGYKVSSALSGWSNVTNPCTMANSNDFGFLVAMR